MPTPEEVAKLHAKASVLVGNLVLHENEEGNVGLVYVTWPMALKMAEEGYGLPTDW